mgnify:CR=1 FL=1
MKRVGIAVGINQCRSKNSHKLRFAESDCERFSSAVCKKMNFQFTTLNHHEATRDKILRELEKQCRQLKKEDDQLIFYFAGHGERVGGCFVLHPYDADRHTAERSLSIDAIRSVFDTHAFKGSIMCIFDACRNEKNDAGKGRAYLDATSVRNLESLAGSSNGKQIQVLFGCQEGKFSFEDATLGQGHGVLTYHLLSVLDRVDEYTSLSFREWSDLAGDLMRDRTQSPEATPSQSPVLYRPTTEREIPLLPGKKITTPSGIDFCLIRGGKFRMGSPTDEPGGEDWERPAHTVLLSDFYMSMYPVTVGQFEPFSPVLWPVTVNSNQSRATSVLDRVLEPSSRFRSQVFSAMRPVTEISWHDAQSFCRWCSQQNPGTFHLPTEAQWEYACRAGTTTAYSFGNTLTRTVAHFGTKDDCAKDVGSYPPNAWGLHDMHGGVYEWCEDVFDPSFYKSLREGARDPICRQEAPKRVQEDFIMKSTNCSIAPHDADYVMQVGVMIATLMKDARVVRGGFYGGRTQRCRSAHRIQRVADMRYEWLGFRMVWKPKTCGG